MNNATFRLMQSFRNFRALPDILNRRSKVELQLWDCYAGRRPLPDAEQCKEWALDLSIPSKLRHPDK